MIDGYVQLRECLKLASPLGKKEIRQLNLKERKTLVAACRAFSRGEDFQTKELSERLKEVATPQTRSPKTPLLLKIWNVFVSIFEFLGDTLRVPLSAARVKKTVADVYIKPIPSSYFKKVVGDFSALVEKNKDLNFEKLLPKKFDSAVADCENAAKRLNQIERLVENLDVDKDDAGLFDTLKQELALLNAALNSIRPELKNVDRRQQFYDWSYRALVIRERINNRSKLSGSMVHPKRQDGSISSQLSDLKNPPLGVPYAVVLENADYRKKDLVSMMKGKDLKVYPERLDGDEGTSDNIIVGPSAFAVDLYRCDEFNINRKRYYKAKSTVPGERIEDRKEVGKELYRWLGEEGAHRVMCLCHQGLLGKLYEKEIFSPTTSGSGASGLIFNVQIDPKQNLVQISAKLPMVIKDEEFKTHPPHFFVWRGDIFIPIDELTREGFDRVADPVPNLRVRDVVSELVIDNLKKAKALFEAY